MVTYRLATEADYENINNFYNRIYKSSRTLDQFLWEFHNSPFGKSIYVIAEDNKNIVGTNCVIPYDIITTEKTIIKTGKSEDTLVDPEYRGQKIFYNIYEFLFEKCKEANIKVIWGFTSAKKPFNKLGFDTPYYHEQCIAVRDVFKSYAYLSSLKKNNSGYDRMKILGLSLLSKIKTINKFKDYKIKFRVEESNNIEGVDRLILSNLTSTFAINQTSDFQSWRIYMNPNYYKVHTFSFYNDKELVAIIVFNSYPNKVAFVCQSTFSHTLDNIEKIKILQKATHYLFKREVIMIRNWVFNTNELNKEEILIQKKAGFTHIKRGINLVWKELEAVKIQPENFYLSRIASQGI